jgi:hypothetical protein
MEGELCIVYGYDRSGAYSDRFGFNLAPVNGSYASWGDGCPPCVAPGGGGMNEPRKTLSESASGGISSYIFIFDPEVCKRDD